MRIACSRIGSGSLDFTKSGKTLLRMGSYSVPVKHSCCGTGVLFELVLKSFFALFWVNVVPLACILRLLSILIANLQLAVRMLSHLGSPPLSLTRHAKLTEIGRP